jgi:hypothetical protein
MTKREKGHCPAAIAAATGTNEFLRALLRCGLLALLVAAVFLGTSTPALAQGDTGTIVGTVTDASGAVVANARVVATNTATGAKTEIQTSDAGDYTLADLRAGVYNLNITATGFKQFQENGIKVEVAINFRVNAKLEVGATTESVVVTGAAPLLQTEDSEESQNISGDFGNELPLNFGGGVGNSGAIRDALAFVTLAPGVSNQGGQDSANMNNLGGGNWRTLYAGQDATASNSNSSGELDTGGSGELIAEFTLQQSNFAPEYGGATSAIINLTPRAGTNQLHGGAYLYAANGAFDAYQNYQTTLNGTQVIPTKPVEHKFDGGVTLGGPVWIPKLYNGKNRTFFFFNFEDFGNNFGTTGINTLPTAAMRTGDFSAVLGPTIGTDATGASMIQNEIYDPASVHTLANGRIVANPFTGPNGQLNIIPASRLDPVALKIQALLPNPVLNNVTVNNWPFDAISQKRQKIPGFTLDHNLGSTGHLSSYWSDTISHQVFSAGPWPIPLSQARIARVTGQVIRLNYTDAITPTKIIQLGTGLMLYYDPDSSPDSVLAYDAVKNFGLNGPAVNGMPLMNMGLNGSYGGSSSFGPTNANHYHNDKITENASLTWTHGPHTLKFGGNFFIDTWGDDNEKGSTGVFNFGAGQTGNFDSLQTFAGGTGVGFAYASYLLGLAGTATTQPYEAPYVRRRSWAGYAQDSWRVNSKLTATYGVRWDYNGWLTEKHNRMSEFSPTTPIPTLGSNIMGGLIYTGYGTGRCNCEFVKPYWLNISPRVGLAYQVDSKTVARGGVGLSYGQPNAMGWFTNNSNLFYGVGWNVVNFQTSQFDGAGAVLGQGLNYDHSLLTTATIGNPAAGAYIPTLTAPTGIQSNAPWIMDPNLNKLPRILSWSLGLQRQVARDIMVEASWVGNHGVREYSTFNQINLVNPKTFTARGIDVTNPATQTVLQSNIGTAAAIAAGYSLPYPSFPTNTTVLQSLRPYPEYTGVTDEWGNQGGSTYQSMQSKITKRGKNGLTLTSAFTWSKSYNRTTCNGNVFDGLCMDLGGSDQPWIWVVAFSYEIQKFGSNKILNAIVPGWTIGGLGDYGAAMPLGVPGQSGSPNTSSVTGQSSRALRVPGVPLFLVDPNCHCYDPSKTQILNPAAWTNSPIGTFAATTPYYSDFRGKRFPSESASLGRRFRIKEHVTLQVRAEFFNVFNRTIFGNPSTSIGPITYSNGLINGGFGTVNIKGNLSTGPRNGQIVARVQF